MPSRKERTALITGDGRTLPEDILEFLSWSAPYESFCIGRSYNKLIENGGLFHHWGDVDGTSSKWWADHLPDRDKVLTHTIGEAAGFDIDWEVSVPWDDHVRWRGSSSLFAAMACAEMGFEKIILAGCPLDKQGHWFWPEEYPGPDWAEEDYNAWREFAKLPQAERIRSLSGFTADIMGKADKEWV